VSQKKLHIKNANTHNLKNISVDIPLEIMTGIAGVSGSGKSSLISDTLVPKLKEILKTKCVMEENGEQRANIELLGVNNIKKCYYAHLHGESHKDAFEGNNDGINYKLVSSDYLRFDLLKIN